MDRTALQRNKLTFTTFTMENKGIFCAAFARRKSCSVVFPWPGPGRGRSWP
jgi:hypothetical protein